MLIRPTRRQLIALAGAALCTGTARAQGPALLTGARPVETLEGRAFASHWRVTLPSGSFGDGLRAGLEQLLVQVDRQMSPWRSDSEISRFNTGHGETAVSPGVTRVARAALDIARSSAGAFDPTVGPLVARWGFGRISGSGAGNWEGLSADEDVLVKRDPGLTMDLCGIAKGYALDLMAAHLLESGHPDFLIDLGGELKSAGTHPEGRDWRVAIEDPRPSVEGAFAGLRLPSGLSVATSGLRAQSYGLAGHRYGHIIDPRTARPAEGATASVSVLDPSAMAADGWATALVAAGVSGPEIARRNGIAALFLIETGEGLRVETIGGFDRHMM
ncbi:FAD:protein FMN transferase [Sedimentimonas flavescens]|uniref:FAD:protein FMN transferase n=1 Tax=Sedimentimonas flavescens TaxID=2851012 RepID=A0ABT3A0R3_9RHOB|nr:FAD:protein FMN transferase [Sedimentimonas flavescens]MCV2879592.1 FAD:protein FMN transferase [Sedimentimonas flavescens]